MELTLRHKLLIERGDGFTVMCELRKSPYNLKPGDARKFISRYNTEIEQRREMERVNPGLHEDAFLDSQDRLENEGVRQCHEENNNI